MRSKFRENRRDGILKVRRRTLTVEPSEILNFQNQVWFMLRLFRGQKEDTIEEKIGGTSVLYKQNIYTK